MARVIEVANYGDAFVGAGEAESRGSMYFRSVREARRYAEQNIEGEEELYMDRLTVTRDPVALLNHEQFVIHREPLLVRTNGKWHKPKVEA